MRGARSVGTTTCKSFETGPRLADRTPGTETAAASTKAAWAPFNGEADVRRRSDSRISYPNRLSRGIAADRDIHRSSVPTRNRHRAELLGAEYVQPMQLSDVELDNVFNVAMILGPTSSRCGGVHATLSRAFLVIPARPLHSSVATPIMQFARRMSLSNPAPYVFGYVTATLATFFVDRDADQPDAAVAGERSDS